MKEAPMPDHAIPDRRIPLHVSVKIRHGIVRAERERLGMTQRQFAELAGDGVARRRVRGCPIAGCKRWSATC